MNRQGFAAAAALLAAAIFWAPQASASPPTHTISGRVDSVDYSQGTIVVRRGGERITIAVVPSTQIYLHDSSGTFADVRPGAQIDVFVSEIDGHLVAQIIHLK